MFAQRIARGGVAMLMLLLLALPVRAQSFRVQCPFTTATHPDPTDTTHGGVKCQQISGGDGYATMGDGVQTYLFAFGPLSGLADIRNGLPGTEPASVFNVPGDPYTDMTYNGAVGLTQDGAAVDATTPAGEQLIVGHVDPRPIMDIGIMNGNIPAPTMAIDEDDEFFLTLTNVGMIMRPDLFEQHTVHFHGYPNASSFYDGVPDASVAMNIGGSFTYYYLAPDAGTYFWHCHVTPPEHLQMGMVGQIFVRPRQNRVPAGATLYNALFTQQADPRTRCGTDILCSTPLPPANGVMHVLNKSGTPTLYAYNDGDGSTAYDVEYPIQIDGFDPNFHFVSMTFNPEPFSDMKDKYFMLNGRSYPDTVNSCLPRDPSGTCRPGTGEAPITTQVADGTKHFSQPLPTLINIPVGGKALLRISDLDVTEFQTLASLGIPMHVIGVNARLLRDMAGNDMTYYTNSITLGGGESLDAILDASDTTKYPAGTTYYLYTPNLDHLANDAENFGGLMTEVHICNAVDPMTKKCS
jgi:FtsP/CotA-like multicopper oxidase with cupredoxin domain